MHKVENSEALRRISDRLPPHIRRRWQYKADEITEVQRRDILFSDMASFVEKEARAMSHPVFGEDWKNSQDKYQDKKSATPAPQKKSGFATNVTGDAQKPQSSAAGISHTSSASAPHQDKGSSSATSTTNNRTNQQPQPKV